MMASRRTWASEISKEQAKTVGANIRSLRKRKGWSQRQLGRLMGWATPSTVCAAEGHRDGRQRGFTLAEVRRLADIFDCEPWLLTTRCANCDGRPPSGFTCGSCGAPGA